MFVKIFTTPLLGCSHKFRWLKVQWDMVWLRKKLRPLGLTRAEEGILKQVAVLAERPLSECFQDVDSFDSGVEQVLAICEDASPVERVDLIRNLGTLRKKLGFNQASPQTPISSTRVLPLGQRVLLRCMHPQESGNLLPASIFMLDDERILLRMEAGEIPPAAYFNLAVGEEIKVEFVRVNDCAYSFHSKIAAIRPKPPGFLLINHAPDLVREQKRRYLRVDLYEKVHFLWFPGKSPLSQLESESSVKNLVEMRAGIITSLSGGGMRLQVEGINLQEDDWLEVYFPFLPPPSHEESCYVRVVKIYAPPPQGIFGLEIVTISIRLRTEIIREVERRDRVLKKAMGAQPSVNP